MMPIMIPLRYFLASAITCVSLGVLALQDDSKVPILAYHSRNAAAPCTEETVDVLAMANHIQIARDMGFTIVPLQDVVDWQLGRRSSASMPEKVVAITSDDGFDRDWMSDIPAASDTEYSHHPCHGLPSVKRIAVMSQAPVTLFVIGSRQARLALSKDWFNDNWWSEATGNPYLSVQNHSSDHETQSLTQQEWDEGLKAYVPASGYADGIWQGMADPNRWSNYDSADVAIRRSAQYIYEHSGKWPTLFAYPWGVASHYVHDTYFPGFTSEHKTDAAFCTTSAYLTRTSDRWCLPRITFGYDYKNDNEFIVWMNGAK